MGLVSRDGNVYYYRNRRVGDRVVTEYVGSGLAAQLSAAYDERDRTREWKERQAARALERENVSLDAEIDDLGEMVEALAAAHLLAAGFHRHKREWRRRRDGKQGA